MLEHVVMCPDCGAPMAQRCSTYGPFWGCSRYPACRATHGAHPDGSPLGVPANSATKRARIEAHAAFDLLWRTGRMKRNEAYRWLAEQLGIERRACHIANFDAATCARVVEIASGAANAVEGQG